MIKPWYARFFGQIRVERDDETITRFRSQKTALLFAFLACNMHRDHGREELIARFWPEDDLDAGRNNLRVALSSLRKVLEPPPTPADSLLLTTRTHVRLRPNTVYTDVGEFEAALKAGRFTDALTIYEAGPFLPGFYEEWALQERERIEALAESARLKSVQNTAPDPSARPAIPSGAVERTVTFTVPHNLPVTTDRFFGREEEISRLEMLLLNPIPEARVITITGPGGAGKTRLAIETVRRLLNGKANGGARTLLTGGIWYTPLAEVREAPELAGTIAMRLRQSLGLPGDGHHDPLSQVQETIGSQRTLLLLDNLEQVAAGAMAALPLFLERLPGCTLLVTSRVRMGMRGEQVLALAPLPVPDGDVDRDTLVRSPAARLFADRAQSVETDFALTAGNAGEVARLLRLLEGVPLAIELAAAWANVLTPRQMREQIEQRLADRSPASLGEAFPIRQPSGREARHHSLRAAFQWSYDLLSTEVRRLLARLSVFRGGFTAEAVAPICAVPDAAGTLSQLHSHSLLTGRPTPDGAAIRFSLLESLREFAAAQLQTEERAELAARHTAYFLGLAEEMRPLYGTANTARALDRIEKEQDNIRAALDRAIQEPGQAETALRLAAALQWPWRLRGPLPEGRRYLSTILSLPDSQSATRFRADALNALGSIAITQRDMAEARVRYQESLELCRRLDYTQGRIAALSNLATTFMDSGDFEAARPLFEEALALVRETGHKGREAIVLYNLGNLAHWRRELDDAERYHADALSIRRELGDTRGMALSLVGLGILAMERRDFSNARARLCEGLRLQYELGDRSQIDTALENVARSEEGMERWERGVVLRAAAEALRPRLNIASSPLRQEALDSEALSLREILGERRFLRARTWGAMLDLDDAVAFALDERSPFPPIDP